MIYHLHFNLICYGKMNGQMLDFEVSFPILNDQKINSYIRWRKLNIIY